MPPSRSAIPDRLARVARPEFWQIASFGVRFRIWTTIGASLAAGDRWPSYYVLGYPKSGTNWVCNMLAEYLDQPVYEFWASAWPRLRPSILHMHRFLPFDSARRRTLYLLRDGRDILISDYHHRMRERAENPALAEQLRHYLGDGYDPANVRGNLLPFLDYFRERVEGSTNYVDHIEEAFAHPYERLRYEDLLAGPVAALREPLARLLGGPVDERRLEAAVAKHTFENVTGRSAGTESSTEFVRKGIAGEWRTEFTREVARAYDAWAGAALIAAGYEADRRWVEECDPA